MSKNLQILIERSCDLSGRIDDQFHHDSFSFCRHCSGHDLYCGVAEMTMEEREKLGAIRDSLKQVQNMLILAQGLESCQMRRYDAALKSLEERRRILIQKLEEYPLQGRKQELIKGLKAGFADFKLMFTLRNQVENEREMKMKKRARKFFPSFLLSRIWSWLDPRKWFKKTGMALTLIFIAACIPSTRKMSRCRQNIYGLVKINQISSLDSKMGEKTRLFAFDSGENVTILSGRG